MQKAAVIPGSAGRRLEQNMIFEGCQGKPEITIEEKVCPQCGNVIEVFSIDTEVACDRCGFVVYNDALNCVQWCQYARQCVGDKRYEQLMKVAESQKKRREKEKAAAN